MERVRLTSQRLALARLTRSSLQVGCVSLSWVPCEVWPEEVWRAARALAEKPGFKRWPDGTEAALAASLARAESLPPSDLTTASQEMRDVWQRFERDIGPGFGVLAAHPGLVFWSDEVVALSRSLAVSTPAELTREVIFELGTMRATRSIVRRDEDATAPSIWSSAFARNGGSLAQACETVRRLGVAALLEAHVNMRNLDSSPFLSVSRDPNIGDRVTMSSHLRNGGVVESAETTVAVADTLRMSQDESLLFYWEAADFAGEPSSR